MQIKIKPSMVARKITAPPSKSYTHRVIILASLAQGQSVIRNCLLADDTLYTLKACQLLGAKTNLKKNKLEVIGTNGNLKVNPQKNKIFMGNSGTTMRLMTSVVALAKEEVILTGDKRLQERPMSDLIVALKNLGIKVESINKNGCPPIKVKGEDLNGGEVKISGKISSQFISSLLLVSPFAKKDITIKIIDKLKSKPYVDITCNMMKKFGVQVKNNHYQEFLIKTGQRYKAQKCQVEGDYSSASYFFAAAAICPSKITVKGLNINSAQGDKYFLNLLTKMGCSVRKKKKEITVIGKENLKSIKVDMRDYPDIVQSLSIVASCAKGKTTIKNIGHLRYKETDRIRATATELEKMNIKVKTTKDSITIDGGQPKGATIETYNDHRMALSFAILGLKAKGGTIIKNAQVISKSYPNFFKDLKKLGAKITEER